MIAIDYEKQIMMIEGEASRALQVLSEGREAHETIGYLIASMARIYVFIHDCELLPSYQAEVTLELISEVHEDRWRNIRDSLGKTLLFMQDPMSYGVGQSEHAHE